MGENFLANTSFCLKNKRLTIGYIGGSITYGLSSARGITADGNAENDGGDALKSYVNLTTAWFCENYPDANIDFVNAGISDTGTAYANCRLERDLMNTNGHGMPDLVFVEFTSNDWIYDHGDIRQGKAEVKRLAESLVRNIYKINKYADIVFLFTARSEKSIARKAYIEIAEVYNILCIDVGIPLQNEIEKNGISAETEGCFYYTVDNLHPSFYGYEVYFREIEKNLRKYITDATDLTDKTANLPKPVCRSLWTNPQFIPAEDITIHSCAELSGPLKLVTLGTSKTERKIINASESSINILHGGACVEFEFTGTAFALLLGMTPSGFNIFYRIDGKDKKNFSASDKMFGFQRYNNTQLFVPEHELVYGKHTVKMTFESADGKPIDVKLGGVYYAGEDNYLQKLVALTFDDGPYTENTEKMLEVLKENDAHATFFFISNKINEQTYDICKKVYEYGSEIGNHSDDHCSYWELTKEQVEEKFIASQEKIKEASGVYPKVYRSPGCAKTKNIYDAIPIPQIGGYFGCPDWERDLCVEERVRCIREDTVNGRIILMHDVPLNVDALKITLPELTAKGFKAVSVSELMTLRGYRPPDYPHIEFREFE